MQRALSVCMAALAALSFASAAAPRARAAEWAASPRLDAVLEAAVEQGTIPGAVFVAGRRGEILHRKAYGLRSLVPQREEMTTDTIFDCASLTKVLATAPAAMMLVEEGKLRLNDPVKRYLPEFSGGKSLRVLELLTHFSGLRPVLDAETGWSGYEAGIEKALAEAPVTEPGRRFRYSDINFILLAEIVRRLGGKPLDEFAAERIFGPLGMTETMFRPAEELHSRIAPAERVAGGAVLRGVVHDPVARRMGGVAGHAGVFSTADDLARFARMMLNGGELDGVRVLSPLSVARMTTPQSPEGAPWRGLGWDIDSPYSSPRGDLFPKGGYGHTGFTGVSMWLDPATDTFVILLTNRVHPSPKSSIVSLRSRVASVVAAALTDVDAGAVRRAALARASAEASPVSPANPRTAEVLSGLDVLARDGFAPLRGKKIGLITNHTGLDRRGRRGIDLLAEAPDVELAAIFAPEHGLAGELDQPDVPDSADAATGVPVYSLYRDESKRPREEILRRLDAVVFDIQDAGARFFTYATTMAYAMEEAARLNIPFFVLDRPNPINGVTVEGPTLDDDLRSFVGYFPMPVRHGMTMGELALLFNAEREIGARLEVVRMEGWRRRMWFDETGLPWVNPSPNLRTVRQAALYPGIALLEGLQSVSVGRGTGSPFEFIAAPWIDGAVLARRLNERRLPGVRAYPGRRKPRSSRFAGRWIEGVQLDVLDREALRPTRLGLELLSLLRRSGPDQIRLPETLRLVGDRRTLQELKQNARVSRIWNRWEDEKVRFLRRRVRHLLYQE